MPGSGQNVSEARPRTETRRRAVSTYVQAAVLVGWWYLVVAEPAYARPARPQPSTGRGGYDKTKLLAVEK